jgi:predicted phosphodiesterase
MREHAYEPLAARRIAVFGGVYANYLALEATLRDARRRGAEAFYCLGDLGGFGPHPDRVFPLLAEHGVRVVQGNYDHSVGDALDDCGCGYSDPRDNHFAQISYDYTLANTSDDNRSYLRGLPPALRVELGGRRLLMCHGSPRRVNEFLWETQTPNGLIERLCADHDCDAVLCTHTGIKWQRQLPSGRRLINVGAIGRPENDGLPRVWYALLEPASGDLDLQFVPVDYDHGRLAREMETEALPAEFIETIRSGWWTTCLEILPAKERLRGRF